MAIPTIVSLSPASATAGGTTFVLSLVGTNFDSSLVVYWGTKALVTTYMTSTTATASVPAVLIQYAGGAVISATTTGGATPGPGISFLVTTPLDLTSVQQVKNWTSANGQAAPSVTDDSNIQVSISGFSLNFLLQTGLSTGSTPTESPFCQTVSYNEWYNGNGNNQLFVRHYPIQSVTSLTVGTLGIGPSNGVTQAGYIIAPDQKSIYIRNALCGGIGGWGGGRWAWGLLSGYGVYNFMRGTMNINIQYVGGYPVTPYDIAETATVAVAQNWRRNTTNLDTESQAMGAMGGTIKFRDWVLPPNYMNVVRSYTRTSYA